MMVDNSMGLAKIEASGVDLTNLKTFYMPYTDEEGNFNHIVQGDFFLGITNTSENPELAEAFLEFYFAEFYPRVHPARGQRQHYDQRTQGQGPVHGVRR